MDFVTFMLDYNVNDKNKINKRFNQMDVCENRKVFRLFSTTFIEFNIIANIVSRIKQTDE